MTSMNYHGIEIPGHRLAEFCRRHRIAKLALFGSIQADLLSAAAWLSLL